jgi:hypothetical protein
MAVSMYWWAMLGGRCRCTRRHGYWCWCIGGVDVLVGGARRAVSMYSSPWICNLFFLNNT